MQSIAETCVRFDAAHLSINLVSEIAVPMFTTLKGRHVDNKAKDSWLYFKTPSTKCVGSGLTGGASKWFQSSYNHCKV